MENVDITNYLIQPGGLANLLRQARIMANLSMRALGSRAGWKSARVSKIETGTQMPKKDDINAWIAACQCDENMQSRLFEAWERFNTVFPSGSEFARKTKPTAKRQADSAAFRIGYQQGWSDAIEALTDQIRRLPVPNPPAAPVLPTDPDGDSWG